MVPRGVTGRGSVRSALARGWSPRPAVAATVRRADGPGRGGGDPRRGVPDGRGPVAGDGRRGTANRPDVVHCPVPRPSHAAQLDPSSRLPAPRSGLSDDPSGKTSQAAYLRRPLTSSVIPRPLPAPVLRSPVGTFPST